LSFGQTNPSLVSEHIIGRDKQFRKMSPVITLEGWWTKSSLEYVFALVIERHEKNGGKRCTRNYREGD
jgi:hypothetical protein